MMAALALAGVSVSIGGARILDDVSVAFAPGLVTALIGPNGAGKSTLLSVAAGYLAPDRGSVTLGGEELARIPVRRAAQLRAVMAQDSTVAFPFTVREVVAMGRTPWNTTPGDDDAIVSRVLHLTELTEFADREITTLSGGERQRAAFARVLAQAMPVHEASVLLLDEPTAAMDIAHAESTLRLARGIAARGAAVGIVVHDLDAAASYGDHLVLMDRGRVHAAGPVREVCTPELLSGVYRTPIDVLEHAGRVRIAPSRGEQRAAGLSDTAELAAGLSLDL
ncbi:heme ABC transporter ATP-binding protein [Pseudactinotalea sp. HY158]|nr:heme ABC transporter ATP-binding protein [Pseudactinotalea sp. HY158]